MNKEILNNVHKEIGRVLKAYREKLGRNQRDVAESAGISFSMLSQIERGLVLPSVDTLFLLCDALGMEPVELFGRLSRRKTVTVHRPGKRLATSKGGVVYEQLIASANAGWPAEMILLEINAGSSTVPTREGHEGVEMGYVLEGSAVLHIGNESVGLETGDAVSYASHQPHFLENAGNDIFRAVWSIQPPHKDYLEK